MIPILYPSDEAAFVTNGLGRLYDCTSCTVTEERNGIFECDFSYPVAGAHFNDILLGRIIAAAHDDTGEIQPFDIVSCSRPINGIVSFHAVHVSYRLSKRVAIGSGINSLHDALSLLASAAGQPWVFTTNMERTGYMSAADGVPRSIRQLLGGVEGSVLDTYRGEFKWDKWTVSLLSARGSAKDISIRYGVDLTDYKEDLDYSEAFSSVIPYWNGSGGTIVIGNKQTSPNGSYNGRDECIPLDLTDKFQTEPTTEELNDYGKTYISSAQTGLPKQSINVSFIRLSDALEYSGLASLYRCSLCDTIRVVFPRYNMQGKFKIVKTVYDVLLERFTEMELGTLSTTLSEALGISGGR